MGNLKHGKIHIKAMLKLVKLAPFPKTICEVKRNFLLNILKILVSKPFMDQK